MEESNPSGTEWMTVQPVKIVDTEIQQEVKSHGERLQQMEEMLKKTLELSTTGQLQAPAPTSESTPSGQVQTEQTAAGVFKADCTRFPGQ